MRILPVLLALALGAAAVRVASAQQPRAGELITGIVHQQGAGAQSPGGLWTLHFSLEAWRGADGIIHATPLVIQRTVSSYEEVSALMERINATRIISARIRSKGAGFAELLKLVDADLPADDPLVVRAAELAKPVTREDARFGTLALDRRLPAWLGRVPWAGDTIDLYLTAADEDSLRAALEVARALWDDEAAWSERIRAFAVEQLLPMKNEGWLDDGEEPLTPARFLARMRLEVIAVEVDGSFTFWHKDGDMFAGHSILVTGTLRDGPTHADIAG